MENKILEDLKAKLKSLQNKINAKNIKIEKKNEEIKEGKLEITRIEGTRKEDNPKFEAFNEMVDEDVKNRNKDILKKEKEIAQEKENIKKIEEEKKIAVENAKSEVKKDSSKKLVQINKLNDKVKGLKESARKLKQAKLATTDKSVYKVNDEQHKLKIEEIKKVYREKNTLYKECQENEKVLEEIEKIEINVLANSEQEKSEQNIPEQDKQVQNIVEQNEPEQNVPVQNIVEQDEPEQNVPVQNIVEQNEPEQNVPEQNIAEQGEPEQEKPQSKEIDTYLLNKVAKEKNMDLIQCIEEIESRANFHRLSIQEMLENEAQRLEIIPKQITEIIVEGDEYYVKYGSEELSWQSDYYYIGTEENDINIDRKSKEELRKVLLAKYPDFKKEIKKCDIGILKILSENNKELDDNLKGYAVVDMCKEYLQSMREKEKSEKMPDISYDLTYTKSLLEKDVFARNNARNNREIAKEVKGLSKNPIIIAYDFIQEKYESIANWFDEKVLALGDGKNKEKTDEEVIDSQDQNDLAQENNEPSFREGIYNKEAAENVIIVGQTAGEKAQENAQEAETQLDSQGKAIREE